MGYSQKERQYIALIARYHRKGSVLKKNSDCQGLTDSELNILRFLASILRLVVASQRTRTGDIESLSFSVNKTSLSLKMLYSCEEAPELELRKADIEKKALEEALGLSLELSLSKL